MKAQDKILSALCSAVRVTVEQQWLRQRKSPSPPRSGGEGRGEEVPAFVEETPLFGSLPARASRSERENAD